MGFYNVRTPPSKLKPDQSSPFSFVSAGGDFREPFQLSKFLDEQWYMKCIHF
jgi:hypothetical protein